MKPQLRYLLLALGLTVSSLATAVIDPDNIEDPALRARYQHFIDDLRCPKCQNENLAGSNAPIAADLRQELRRLLRAGKTDRQIRDYMVSRYGDFILYKPPLDSHTAVLWFAPLGLLVIGVGVVGTVVWRRRRTAGASAAAPLSADEQARLSRLLEQGKASPKADGGEQA